MSLWKNVVAGREQSPQGPEGSGPQGHESVGARVLSSPSTQDATVVKLLLRLRCSLLI